VKNGIDTTLDSLEALTIDRLARRYGYVSTPEIVATFGRVAALLRRHIDGWHDISHDRRCTLLVELRDAMVAFLREEEAPDLSAKRQP